MYSSSALFWVIWNGDRNRTTTRGFGREAVWRQREVSPELPSDLPGETKKKRKKAEGKNMSSQRSESEFLNVWFVTRSCDSSLCFSK